MKSRRAIKRQIRQLEEAYKAILYLSIEVQDSCIKSTVSEFTEWLDKQIYASYMEKAKIEEHNRTQRFAIEELEMQKLVLTGGKSMPSDHNTHSSWHDKPTLQGRESLSQTRHIEHSDIVQSNEGMTIFFLIHS